MFKVVQKLTVKVGGQVKTFQPGSIVRLPEAAAQMFIQQGKIEKVFEKVFKKAESNKLKPSRYICPLCGGYGKRLMFNQNRVGKYGWFWYCIHCKPYHYN